MPLYFHSFLHVGSKELRPMSLTTNECLSFVLTFGSWHRSLHYTVIFFFKTSRSVVTLINVTDLIYSLSDFHGIMYSSIQIRSTICMDYFPISRSICRFHFDSDTGKLPVTKPRSLFSCNRIIGSIVVFIQTEYSRKLLVVWHFASFNKDVLEM